jgi:LacI family transcriptional regulator
VSRLHAPDHHQDGVEDAAHAGLDSERLRRDVGQLRKSGLKLEAFKKCDYLVALQVVIDRHRDLPGPAGIYIAAERVVRQALDGLPDQYKESAKALFGADDETSGQRVGARQQKAAKRWVVEGQDKPGLLSVETFRHTRDPAIVTELTQQILTLEAEWWTQNGVAHSSEEAQRITEAQVHNKELFAPGTDSPSGCLDPVLLLVPDLSNPFFAQVTSEFRKALNRQGIHLLVSISEGVNQVDLDLIRKLKRGGLRGLIYIPPAEPILVLDLLDQDFPVLVFDRYVNVPGFDFIGYDSVSATLRAVEYLVDHGHRRIGFLKGRKGVETARERFESFIKAMRDSGLSAMDDLIYEGDYSRDSGCACAESLITREQSERPTAMLAANDLMAIGMMQRLQQANWDLPTDLSVIGFDDIEWSKHFHPALTTIAQPIGGLVARAVEILLERMAQQFQLGRKPHPTVEKFKCVLIERSSVAMPRLSLVRNP